MKPVKTECPWCGKPKPYWSTRMTVQCTHDRKRKVAFKNDLMRDCLEWYYLWKEAIYVSHCYQLNKPLNISPAGHEEAECIVVESWNRFDGLAEELRERFGG